MKLRFLLFFILAFLLGSFSVKAQDLKYNGEVEIKINISKIQAYYVNENRDGDPDNKLNFYKKNKSTEKYDDYFKTYSGTSPQNIKAWRDWTELKLDGRSVTLPYYFYNQSYSIPNLSIKEFLGKIENTVNFKFYAREHDGRKNKDDRYREDCFFTLLNILEGNLSPGWHTSKKFISDGEKHWAVEFEYSITPPSVAIDDFPVTEEREKGDHSFEEGSIVPLKVVKPAGANFEYEWMVQIDNTTMPKSTGRQVVSYIFIDAYEGMYESFPWASALGRPLTSEEEKAPNPYFSFTNEEIRSITRYCESILIYKGDSSLYDLYYNTLIDEYEDIPYFVPAIDSKTKSNITKDGTCDYLLPESNKFYRNFKFRVQTIVRTAGKADLRCIEEDKVMIVDVFPHFPVIENVETTIVTCNINNINGHSDTLANQKDAKVNLKIKGDLGKGVDKYRAQLRKKKTGSNETDVTEWPKYGIGNEFKSDIITFDELEAGEYSVAVSNLFFHSDTIKFQEENPGKKILVGHVVKEFTIGEPKLLQISSYDIVSSKKCDQYEIINIDGNGGVTGSVYTYSLSKDGPFSKESLMLEVSSVDSDTVSYYDNTLWIKDDNGCLAKKDKEKKRNRKLQIGLEKRVNITCYGDEIGVAAISGGYGSGGYKYFEVISGKDKLIKLDSLSKYSGLGGGVHTFKVEDSDGCVAQNDITLNDPQEIEVYDFVNVKQYDNYDIKCHGASDGKVKFKVEGGLANGPDGKPNKYSYTITGQMNKSGDNLPPATDITLEGLKAGNYTLEIIDANGCSLKTSFPFELKQPDVITIKNPEPKYINSKKEKFHFACCDASEDISLEIHGGLPPYTVMHNSSLVPIEKIGEVYKARLVSTKKIKPILYVSDKGCIKEERSVFLIKPSPLTVKFKCSTYKAGLEGEMGEEYQIKKYGGTDTLNVEVRGGITPYSLKLFKDDILVDINDIGGVLDDLDTINGNYIYTGLKKGNYKVEVIGAFGDCSAADSIDLLEPDKLEVDMILSAHNGYNIKCYNETGWLKTKPTGGITPYTLSLSGSGQELPSQDKLFDSLVAGVYKLTVTDKYGIQIEKTDIEIKQPEKLELTLTKTSTYVGGYQIRCSNLTDSVSLTPKYGIIPTADNGFVYTIMRIDKNGNNELLENVTGTEVISDMGAGDYIYVLTDENICYDTLEISLTEPEELVFSSVLHKIPSCHEMDKVGLKNDGEIKVKAKGGNFKADEFKVYDFLLAKQAEDFSFTPIDTLRGEDVNFELLKTGNYQVTVVDSNTCMTTTRVSVGQPPLLYLDYFQSYKPKCYNSFDGFWKSKIIGGTPRVDGYDFSILKDTETFIASNSSIDSINTIGLEKGTYQIQIHDSLQCYFEQEIILPNPDPLEIRFKVLGTSAFGALDGEVKAMITGGTATDYKYKWYHKGLELKGENGTEIKMKPAGDYTVEVWDANNCPYGDSPFGRLNGLKKTVSVKGPGELLSLSVLRAEPASYVGKPDASVDLTAIGGWLGYQYSIGKRNWQIKSVFENLLAGSYYARVRDAKGIIDSIMVTLNELPQIIADLNVTNVNCKGEYSGRLDFKVKGGSSPYQYSLNKGQFYQTESIFTRLKANTYTLWVEDKRGNTEQFSFEISEPEKLEIIVLEQNSSTCSESNGSAKLSINGGIRPYQLNWDHTELGSSLNPENLASGSYRITAIDGNGCFDEKIINIADKNGPELFLKDLVPVSCHDKKDGLVGVDIKGGKEPYVISWNNDSEKNNSYVEGLGMGTYNVTVRDANNCFGSAKYEIEGPPDLQFYVSSLQPPNCVGIDDGSIQFKAEGGTPEYIYRLNDNSNTTGWFPNLGVGNLQLEVTDSHGCKKALEAELSAPVPLTIDLPKEYVLCRNQTETISSGMDGASSKWFFGENQFSTNDEVELSEEGDYRLVVTSEKGCEAEHEFTIAFLDYEVVADFIIPVEAIVGDTIVAVDISWEQPDSVEWHFSDGLEVVKREEASIWLRVLEAGNHTIGMSIFKNECSDYMEKQVVVAGSSTKRKAGFIQPEQVYITEAKLYPNPNRGDFHLKLLLSKVADVSLEIYDVQRALKIDTHEGQNSAVYQFDFNNKSIFRPNNVYAVVIIAGNDKRVFRFLVY